MTDKTLSQVIGGGGLPRLAPDLTFPSSLASGVSYKEATGIDATGSLTTLLTLTGKHIINLLEIQSLTSESITVKLTVDGEVKWNDTFALPSTVLSLLGNNLSSATSTDYFTCNSSLLLELQTTTDNSVTFRHLERPIL